MEDLEHEYKREAPINVSPEQFRSTGHALVDRVADLLAGMRERKVTAGLPASEIRTLINASAGVPLEGCDLDAVVSEAADLLTQYSLYNGHPKFLGYITSSPAPVGMLADFLASAVNPNVGAWALSPVATEIEMQTIRWIAELLGYPSNCSGILVSGGNMANLVGFYTALRSVFPRDAANRTHERFAQATVYASSETHTWIEKAMDMFGLPTDGLRVVRNDAHRRLEVADLRARLEADLESGRIPVAVIGSAGTVSTGAVDPLPAIAEVCREHKVWFHVDGAYGGFAAMARSAPEEIRGLALADSLAIDPHKWLYAPLEAGCALVRDPEKHRTAFSYHPPYFHFGEEVRNFVDFGPQTSRGFRALKVWMALKQVGRRGYEKMISEDITLARELFNRVSANPNFEAFTCNLSIVTFRFVPSGYRDRTNEPAVAEYLNQLNKALLSRLEASGEVFVSNAVIADRFLLRACIVNFRTTAEDVAEVPEMIARYGEQVHRELKPTA